MSACGAREAKSRFDREKFEFRLGINASLSWLPWTELLGQDDHMPTKMNGVLVAAMIFGSNSMAPASETIMSRVSDATHGAIATSCLPWQAPIGHRQPGAADIGNLLSAPSGQSVQSLDNAVDRALRICRGC
jgi:hypothetical protein